VSKIFQDKGRWFMSGLSDHSHILGAEADQGLLK
jgi:hypothetical protein